MFTLSLAGPLTLTPPSKDDFYNPPYNYEKAKLGDILKVRNPPGKIRSLYFPVNIKNTWQLLVRSEDALGNPNAVVTTVFEPYNGNSSRLLSYQVAEDAVNLDCSPSYVWQDGGTIGTIPNQFEMFLIQAALDQGFYVQSPDYEGPISAFSAGRLAGISTINTIRAVLQSKDITNVEPDAEVVLWGYSGGSFPASWAAGLAPKYAPDIKANLKGAAFGGWVTNITAVAEQLEGTVFAGFVASAIKGLSNQYTDLQGFVKENVRSYKYNYFESIEDVCIVGSIVKFLFAHLFTGPFRFVEDGWAIFQDQVVKDAINPNILGTEENKDVKPEIPLFVYQAKLDEVVPYEHTERVFNKWCGQGMESFEFTTSITSGHISEAVEGAGAALGWISSIFNGSTPIQGCVRTDRLNSLFHPETFGGIVDVLKAAFKNIFGVELGPDDSKMMLAFLGKQGVNVDAQKKKNNS